MECHITLRVKQHLSGDEINWQVNTICNHNYRQTKMGEILNILYLEISTDSYDNTEMGNMDPSNQ